MRFCTRTGSPNLASFTSESSSSFLAQDAFEKLGAFYLGRHRDPATGERSTQPLLYESRDLTTHGVIVGMTGSRKTGLALAMLEEAALDRIPVIAIDPKGDLANLFLTFPDLAPEDFRPWVNEEGARQRGEDPEAFAAAQARRWREGLANWGQDGERIRRLRAHADLALYTPGSTAGRSVSVLRSFALPSAAVLADPDAFRERIQSTVTSLLALLGIAADPLRSREHILLSSLLQHAWEHGQSLEIGHLIEAVQRPPFQRVGGMELESVFSIAHLGEDERMFFVSMLLNEIVSWTRGQAGTSSLRALVYMDEIFGFFPPSSNPPSKAPMLTLLKQARAFGVGVLLATQNPVDLDYKGLGNTGSWFIGRLQTERDKARIMDALQGAMAGSNPLARGDLDRLISGLEPRNFLLHNVHAGAPTLFETRWVLSYMAGPMTLHQLRMLAGATRGDGAAAGPPSGDAAPGHGAPGHGAPGEAASPAPPQALADVAALGEGPVPAFGSTPGPLPVPPPVSPPGPSSPPGHSRPLLPPGIPAYFVAPLRGSASLRYAPAIGVFCDVAYRQARAGVDETRPVQVLLPLASGPLAVNWAEAEATELEIAHLEEDPLPGAGFLPLSSEATQPRSYPAWGREAQRWIQANLPLTLFESRTPRALSRPGESEAEFRLRLADLGREARDEAVDRLRKRYESRLRTLQDRELRALQAVERRAGAARQRSLDTALRVGEGLLGAFMGRKTTAARTGTAIRSAGRVLEGRQEVARAEESVESVREQIAALEAELAEELRKVEVGFEGSEALETLQIRPTLTGMSVRLAALLWLPEDASGRSLWR